MFIQVYADIGDYLTAWRLLKEHFRVEDHIRDSLIMQCRGSEKDAIYLALELHG